MSGLDLIRNHQLQTSAILVSSRYDEKRVQEEAKALRIKIIPKTLATIIPLIVV